MVLTALLYILNIDCHTKQCYTFQILLIFNLAFIGVNVKYFGQVALRFHERRHFPLLLGFHKYDRAPINLLRGAQRSASHRPPVGRLT
jgi:hypothetical protein